MEISKGTVGVMIVASAIGGAIIERHVINDSDAQPTERTTEVNVSLPPRLEGTLIDTTSIPNTETQAPETDLPITLPSGASCLGPLIDISVVYVPEWQTYSLFRSVQLQHDPNEKLSSLPGPIAVADAEYIAYELNGFTRQELPNVDDWRPNGLPPTNPVNFPTTCIDDGVLVVK